MGRLGAGHPSPEVVREAIHGMMIKGSEARACLAVVEGHPGGLAGALQEDQEVAREDPEKDPEIRPEDLGSLVMCRAVTGVKIG